jgi:hypothetical protein
MIIPLRIPFAIVLSATGWSQLLSAPAILPQPRTITLGNGSLSIRAGNRIVAEEVVLEPLAKVFASDIQRVHGLRLSTGRKPAAGDIALRLVVDDPKLKGHDAYRISVGKKVIIEGGTYPAIAFGMMSVLQAFENDGDGLKIPQMSVEDDADRALTSARFTGKAAATAKRRSKCSASSCWQHGISAAPPKTKDIWR